MFPGGLGCVGCCVSDVWVLCGWCFVDVSGMPRWGLCDASMMSQRWLPQATGHSPQPTAHSPQPQVLVMLFVMSRSCLGRVSVLSRSCLGLVSVLSRSCLGLVSVVSWSCLGLISVVSRCCFGDVSVLFWCCFVVFLVVFWGSFSDVLVTSRACFDEVSMMCGDGAVMFMMMSGWWLGVVSLMLQCCFYCFGDGVLIFWWTLMNILIGILSKISNSNLKLYIVHLWANQCSCDPYVDGESFKI